MDTVKTCSKCGEVKPVAEFSKDAGKRDGLRYSCKLCQSAWFKTHYASNLEKIRAGVKAYQDSNPEKMRAKSKAWREANPERYAANQRVWEKTNPEKVRRKNKNYSEQLGDGYVVKLLTCTTQIKEVPQYFIEAKRNHIKMLRLLKEPKK